MNFIRAAIRHFSINADEDLQRHIVTLNNVNVEYLLSDLTAVWETKSVAKYSFIKISRSSLDFHSFYVPDLHFSITKILEYKKKKSRTSELKKINEILEKETWFSMYFKEYESILDYSKLKLLKYTLLPPQLEAVKSYDIKVPKLGLHGYIYDAAVGSGKSIFSTGVVLCLNPDIVVVVCPKYILDSVWRDVVENILTDKADRSLWVSNTNEPLVPGKMWYLVHYEALDKFVNFFQKYKYKKPVILLDESHNFNDIKSIRSQTYLAMCRASKSKHIIHTSGTAFKAIGNEAATFLSAADPLFTNDVVDSFRTLYNKAAKRSLSILAHRIGMVSFKITKDQIMGAAKPISIDIKVKMPNSEKYTMPAIKKELDKYIIEKTAQFKKEMPHHEKVFNDAINIYGKTLKTKQEIQELEQYLDYFNTIKSGFRASDMSAMSVWVNKYDKTKIIPKLPSALAKEFKTSKSILKYQKLVITGGFLGNVLGKLRIEMHTEMIKYSRIEKLINDAEGKTIIFTSYIDTLKATKKYLEDKGFMPLAVFAETNKNVNDIINEFKTSDTANPILATFLSMSSGVTLLIANTVIFINQPYRTGEAEQAVARAFRLGQQQQVYLYNFYLDTGEVGNLSTRLKEIIEWSDQQVDIILSRSGTRVISGNTLAYHLIGGNIRYLDYFLTEAKKVLGISNHKI